LGNFLIEFVKISQQLTRVMAAEAADQLATAWHSTTIQLAWGDDNDDAVSVRDEN